jgi:hypothetical protein
MHHIRKVTIVVATICVLALGVFALVKSPAPSGGDVIIIKGGSLEIQCGENQGNDCLGVSDGKGKYKHKKDTAHIMAIVVKNSAGETLYSGPFDATNQPQIEITYK